MPFAAGPRRRAVLRVDMRSTSSGVERRALPRGVDHALRDRQRPLHRVGGAGDRQRVAAQRHAHREELLQLEQVRVGRRPRA